MNKKRKTKLIWLLSSFVGFSLIVALVFYALQKQTDYYYDPSAVATGKAPKNKRIRAGGVVVAGSVTRDTQNPLKVIFDITDYKAKISVAYVGILPDLFKENSGVVATGKWVGNRLIADEILAKHDENYMPPEVQKSLDK